jgi:hypothetical protein
MDRPQPPSSLHCRRAVGVLAAIALVALAAAASADARVTFPAPGAMQFSGLPTQVPAGHTLTLREEMPLAIWGGELYLQRQLPTGAWQTLIVAPPRPRIVWLHWRVPAAWRGSQLTLRFLLDSGGRMLAVSGSYPLTVTR